MVGTAERKNLLLKINIISGPSSRLNDVSVELVNRYTRHTISSAINRTVNLQEPIKSRHTTSTQGLQWRANFKRSVAQLQLNKLKPLSHISIPVAVSSSSFTARRVMHSADYAVARCPSVCLSVCHTPVFCQNGYT